MSSFLHKGISRFASFFYFFLTTHNGIQVQRLQLRLHIFHSDSRILAVLIIYCLEYKKKKNKSLKFNSSHSTTLSNLNRAITSFCLLVISQNQERFAHMPNIVNLLKVNFISYFLSDFYHCFFNWFLLLNVSSTLIVCLYAAFKMRE